MPAVWGCAPDSGYTLQIVSARAESTPHLLDPFGAKPSVPLEDFCRIDLLEYRGERGGGHSPDALEALWDAAVAIRRTLEQGHGHLYNMEGFGSNGRMHPGLSIYGTSKCALRYLSRSLATELHGTPVKASRLSPGMVATDFLTDRPETVTPWLVKRVLANTRSGVLINYLNTWKILGGFATGWAGKRELIEVGRCSDGTANRARRYRRVVHRSVVSELELPGSVASDSRSTSGEQQAGHSGRLSVSIPSREGATSFSGESDGVLCDPYYVNHGTIPE